MEDIGQAEKLRGKRELREKALKHCNKSLEGIFMFLLRLCILLRGKNYINPSMQRIA